MCLYKLLISSLLLIIYLNRSSLISLLKPYLIDDNNHYYQVKSFDYYRVLNSSLSLLFTYPLIALNTNGFNALLICISLVIMNYSFKYYLYYQRIKNETKLLRLQFPIWLRQLQIQLQTSTVPIALERTQKDAPSLIKEPLIRLRAEIYHNARDLNPYLVFLSNYQILEVQRLMKMLYRIQHVGHQDAYTSLLQMIETTGKWLSNERKERKDIALTIYEWWAMLPLLSVTLFFLIVMIEVMQMMLIRG